MPRAEDGKGTRKEMLDANTTLSNLIVSIINFCETNKAITKDELIIFIDKFHNPDKYIKQEDKKEALCEMFQRYVNGWLDTGVIGSGRKKHYDVLLRELNRFLIINNLSDITPTDFNNEKLILFRDFLFNEYILVDKYRGLYVDMNNRNIPTSPRGTKYCCNKIKKATGIFNELESNDEIPVSPFRKLGKQRKTVMMKEQYDEPIFLTKAEFIKLQNTDVPNSLQETKDAFLLQCSLGCRIGDFQTLSFDNIAIEEDILSFITYHTKTLKENDT